MWIETQDGDLINMETGSCVYVDAKINSWNVLFDTTSKIYVLGRYKAEKNAREMLDAFKQKIRRSGEKIFKFKEEGENNELSC